MYGWKFFGFSINYNHSLKVTVSHDHSQSYFDHQKMSHDHLMIKSDWEIGDHHPFTQSLKEEMEKIRTHEKK